jgi:hypothetical protein
MFEKIKEKVAAEAKKKTEELLAFLAQELKRLTSSIEGAVVNGLDTVEGLDDDLVKDIEELHAKADALEAKIRAKLAADTVATSTTGEASAAAAEPEAQAASAEASKS